MSEDAYDPATTFSCKLFTKADDFDNLIECSLCSKWFHYQCTGVTNETNLDDPYHCKECIENGLELHDKFDDAIEENVTTQSKTVTPGNTINVSSNLPSARP